MKYRNLKDGDIIRVGDEWYNPDWEVQGPWYIIDKEHDVLGTMYNPDDYRKMRRVIKDD